MPIPTVYEVNLLPGDELQQWSAAGCSGCDHTTGPGGICVICQPGTRRCIVCARRGPPIASGPPSDPPATP